MSVRRLHDVTGADVPVPDPSLLVHLQFRRFAGCPVCNLHLRSFVRRHAEIAAAGVREVVVFHSSAADLLPYVADLPFPVIPDPSKRLYREFGVESSRRSLLNPRVWPFIAAALARSTWGLLRGRERPPSLLPAGGRWGLPADFLIAPDGEVLASKHGDHAYDQWDVDTVLNLSAR